MRDDIYKQKGEPDTSLVRLSAIGMDAKEG